MNNESEKRGTFRISKKVIYYLETNPEEHVQQLINFPNIKYKKIN